MQEREKIVLIGRNFLLNHPSLERMSGLDSEHVIVKRKEWLKIIKFFEENPQHTEEVIK